jgi:hypothetical protein
MRRSARRLTALAALFMLSACDTAHAPRAHPERVALDSVGRAWKHTVGVDSVRQRGDTTVVWVSPTNWMATDAPQAGVHVGPEGKIINIEWIFGG